MKPDIILTRILEESRINQDYMYNPPAFFTCEHFILNAMLYPVIYTVYQYSLHNPRIIRDRLIEYVNQSVPEDKESFSKNIPPQNSVALDEVIEVASLTAKTEGRSEVTALDILLAIFNDPRLYCSSLLNDQEVLPGAFEDSIKKARTLLNNSDPDLWSRTPQILLDVTNRYMSEEESESTSMEEEEMEDDEFSNVLKKSALDSYTFDLTELEFRNKLTKVIGRTDEIYRALQVLYRCTKNNVLFIGEHGTGKSCLINGIVECIGKNKAGKRLELAQVHSLNLNALIAGTKYRGDLESRVERLIKELDKEETPVLFIDDIHLVFGAGTSSAGSTGNNLSDILKKIVYSDKIRCIGTTTYDDYTRYFEKDKSIADRFTKIDVAEPDKDLALEILTYICKGFSSHHKIKYPQSTIKTVIDLTSQYMSDRRLPDKAIDVLDEAGAYLSLAHATRKAKKGEGRTVTEDIAKMITARLAKIPVEDVKKSEKDMLKELESTLSTNVFGQEKAVKMLCTAVKKARAGFRDLNRCEASFLFVGPTGVGKTELAKVLSETLEEKLIRFDMSEYQEQYTVSRLIGSAPGYVGYENGGLLTDAVRKNPHSIILFDEIEKAHESIYNLLLQVLDYGTLTDNQGRKSDFRSCIIIFTSNAGARDMAKNTLGFETGFTVRDDTASLKEAVARTFSPEFRNRLDAIVPFSHLSTDITSSIAEKAVKKIGERLMAKNVELEYTKEACDLIASKGYSQEFGARNINRTAEQLVAEPLVDEVLFGSLSEGGKILVDARQDEIVWHKK